MYSPSQFFSIKSDTFKESITDRPAMIDGIGLLLKFHFLACFLVMFLIEIVPLITSEK
jgi:hypothetical protein